MMIHVTTYLNGLLAACKSFKTLSTIALVQSPTFFGAYGEWMMTPPPTWEDLAWLREQWDGPMMLKGISRLDDARQAVDVGMSAISVSNHGGNNLDSTPA